MSSKKGNLTCVDTIVSLWTHPMCELLFLFSCTNRSEHRTYKGLIQAPASKKFPLSSVCWAQQVRDEREEGHRPESWQRGPPGSWSGASEPTPRPWIFRSWYWQGVWRPSQKSPNSAVFEIYLRCRIFFFQHKNTHIMLKIKGNKK